MSGRMATPTEVGALVAAAIARSDAIAEAALAGEVALQAEGRPFEPPSTGQIRRAVGALEAAGLVVRVTRSGIGVEIPCLAWWTHG